MIPSRTVGPPPIVSCLTVGAAAEEARAAGEVVAEAGEVVEAGEVM